MTRLVLFDIDGTLLDTSGAGRRAFLAAFREFAGRDVPESVHDFAGRTDAGIVRTLLTRAGLSVPDPVMTSPVFERYLVHLDRELDATGGRPCPGVPELLAELSRVPGIGLGLLTGNIEEAAHRKLARFGLDDYFAFGAYGSDHEDRDRLVPVARARAAGVDPAVGDATPVVLVGDTPLDIQCARAGSAAVLAVATGIYTEEALRPYAPDTLFADLSDTETVVRTLLRLTPPLPPDRATRRTGS